MALDSFFYKVEEYVPNSPPWRREDNRIMWQIYLAFDEIQEKYEMIEWAFENFGSDEKEWKYISHTDYSMILHIFDVEKFVLFKMVWIL